MEGGWEGERKEGIREGVRTGDASLQRIHNQRITAVTADVSTEPRMWRPDGKRLSCLLIPNMTGRIWERIGGSVFSTIKICKSAISAYD